MSQPLLTVSRGNPTPEEIAALVGVLAAWPRPAHDRAAPAGVSAWWASGLPGRGSWPGPGAWRSASLPR